MLKPYDVESPAVESSSPSFAPAVKRAPRKPKVKKLFVLDTNVLMHDKQDARKKIRMPVLALWGKHGVVEALFDCLRDWREVAEDVRGKALNCGHFLPEEKPREVLAEIRRFLEPRT